MSLHSQDYVSEVKAIIDKYKDKIWMPVDVVAKDGYENKIVNIEDVSVNVSICWKLANE